MVAMSNKRAAAHPLSGVDLEFIDADVSADERPNKRAMLLRSGRALGKESAKCSNCKVRPVSDITNVYPDWCLKCDSSLWATRDE